MTITFKYTPELLQRAHELHYKKFFPLRGRIILYLGLLAIWAGLLLLLIKGGGNNLWYSIPLIIYGIAAVVIHYIVSRSIGRRAFKKLKDYQEPFSMTIDDAGLLLEIKSKQYEIPWADIRKALLTDDLALLYPNDAVFFIFPKQNFSPGDFSSFETMVKEKVEKIF